MLKATIKSLLAHKLRLMLTGLAIVLGVGFIAGTYVLTDTMNAAFDQLFDDTSQGVDVFVRDASEFEAQFGGSREPIDESILSVVQEVDGVEVASGSVGGYAQFIDKEGEAITPGGAPTLGFNWGPEPLNPMRLREGAPPADGEVVMDSNTAEAHGFEVGDEVRVITLAPPQAFTISGIATFGNEESLGGATLALFDIATAQELFDKQGQFDSIEAAAEEGLTEIELRMRINSVLPEGVEATTAADVSDEQAEAIQNGLGFFKTALLVFASVALFVGAFLIFNTFSITVAQRTREFALLRALGASGRQVLGSVVIEALIVGLLAAVLGIGTGLLIAMGLEALLGAFGLDLPQAGLQLQMRTVIVSLIVGVTVTLLAAILPARKAAGISPMEALREGTPTIYRLSRKRLIWGTLITLVGVGLLVNGLYFDPAQPVSFVGGGLLVVFLGVSALAPIFARPMAEALGMPLNRVFGMTGRLAQQNATRNPKRTASTAAALMIGLALVGFVSIFAASTKASINKTLDEALRADLVIQSTSFANQVISPRLAQDLRGLDELAAVTSFRFAEFKRESKSFFVTATDPATLPQTAEIGVVEGDIAALEGDGIFLYEGLAQDLGVGLGDDFAMTFAATGPKELEVIGIFDDKTFVGSDYLISLQTYDANFPDKIDSNVLVKVADGVSVDTARVAVEEIADDYPNVEVENQAEAKETYASQIDQLLGLVTALLALALVIALLGITNTLALSVYERTRELGLLRAVGMSRRQTRSMIRWEAVIIVLIGGILGLVLGMFFGWVMVRALENEGITVFAIPGGQLVVYLLLAVLAGVLAAIPPARRAARLNVLEAIATE